MTHFGCLMGNYLDYSNYLLVMGGYLEWGFIVHGNGIRILVVMRLILHSGDLLHEWCYIFREFSSLGLPLFSQG